MILYKAHPELVSNGVQKRWISSLPYLVIAPNPINKSCLEWMSPLWAQFDTA